MHVAKLALAWCAAAHAFVAAPQRETGLARAPRRWHEARRSRETRLGVATPRVVDDASADATTARLIELEVAEWLDREWIEQDCHAALGRTAAASYLEARAAGKDDIGLILQHIGEEITRDFPDEAYVGPWDVANFCSDLLVAQNTGERCECSSVPEVASLAARAEEIRAA